MDNSLVCVYVKIKVFLGCSCEHPIPRTQAFRLTVFTAQNSVPQSATQPKDLDPAVAEASVGWTVAPKGVNLLLLSSKSESKISRHAIGIK